MSSEQIGLWAGFVFTLMIFSYVLGDNFLYRLAIYVFIGLTAGYVTVLTVESILIPWIRGTMIAPANGVGGFAVGLTPFILGLLLLLKGSRRLSRTGNIAIAFIVGIGTAVALVGAITGTLLPLVASTASATRIDVLNGFILFIGVACTLVYFQYVARRQIDASVHRGPLIRLLSGVGQVFIIITLGALYAGAILTSLTVFSERIGFILRRITGG